MIGRACIVMGCIAGCGAAPPVDTSFDPRGSEPAAIALVDRMIRAAGGARAWSEVRELGWLQGLIFDGMLVDVEELVWDRTDSRMRCVRLSVTGAVTVAMGPLSGGGGAAYRIRWGGRRATFIAKQREQLVAEAAAIVRMEAFLLALPFSLKSSGVHLALERERVEPTVLARNDEPSRYDVLRITFDDRPDVFLVVVDKTTTVPVTIEHMRSEQTGGAPEGWSLQSWARVGRLRLATRRVSLASTPGAQLAPFVMPPKWRGRVALSPFPVPSRGLVVVIAAITARAEIDPRQFVPAVDEQ